MTDGSSMVAAATLIGDHTRARMLTALMGGRALTATELADAAGITKQTGSTHLRKLLDARFVAMEAHGRHRYFRIADEDVAQILEELMSFAVRSGTRAQVTGPKDPLLRKARVCYDHLAGELGVLLYASLLQRQAFDFNGEVALSARERCSQNSASTQAPCVARNARLQVCMDWSERRHAARRRGAAGARVIDRLGRSGRLHARSFRPTAKRLARIFHLNGVLHEAV
jgi:DNA-binding transcriptional ArsR family regulator